MSILEISYILVQNCIHFGVKFHTFWSKISYILGWNLIHFGRKSLIFWSLLECCLVQILVQNLTFWSKTSQILVQPLNILVLHCLHCGQKSYILVQNLIHFGHSKILNIWVRILIHFRPKSFTFWSKSQKLWLKNRVHFGSKYHTFWSKISYILVRNLKHSGPNSQAFW